MQLKSTMTPSFQIYTHPEAAWVGLTEQQAIEKGHEVKTGQSGFTANGRAMAAGENAGFVKFVADAKLTVYWVYDWACCV